MSGGLPRAAVGVLLLASACTLGGVQPTPLRGDAKPQTILLMPVSGGMVDEATGRQLLTSAAEALRERGYDVAMPARLGALELRPRPAEELAADARALGADAFMTLRVERWQTVYGPRLLRLIHDVGYRLWDARDGDMLWEMRSRDDWSWTDQVRVLDHEDAREAYFGTSLQREATSPYANDAEIGVVVHRRAFRRLPERG